VARWAFQGAGLAPILAVQVSQDPAPLLFAADSAADVAVIDALSGHVKHIEKHLGQTPWMMLNP
jgi:methylamine dehydrogenase heavy chain